MDFASSLSSMTFVRTSLSLSEITAPKLQPQQSNTLGKMEERDALESGFSQPAGLPDNCLFGLIRLHPKCHLLSERSTIGNRKACSLSIRDSMPLEYPVAVCINKDFITHFATPHIRIRKLPAAPS
jgi:hypothetical protein